MSDDCFFACFGMALEPWPIPEAAVLVSDSVNGIQFLFIGVPDGSLGLRIVRNGTYEDYETDIIVPENSFKIVASINYAPSQPSIRINTIEIAVAPVGSRQKGICFLSSQPPVASKEAAPLSNEVPTNATDAEALFIRTITDLANASTSNDWYLLLKSSAHLRLLLLDGLLHKANERHKLKVQFRVAAQGDPPPLDFDKLWHNIAPHDLPELQLTDVSLDQFLKLRVFESRNDSVTVKDVIRAVANADGGVHLDTRQAQVELVLELDKDTQRFGQVASRHILRDICTVVVASSIPLIGHIQGRSSDVA